MEAEYSIEQSYEPTDGQIETIKALTKSIAEGIGRYYPVKITERLGTFRSKHGEEVEFSSVTRSEDNYHFISTIGVDIKIPGILGRAAIETIANAVRLASSIKND